MQLGLAPARPARARHRHELHTLTYVTLDQANGGIVRNLSRDGMAVLPVAALRPGQRLRMRFELPPRLRLETQGEVIWAEPGGQCGIRFLGLSAGTARRVDEWIFGDLLENTSVHSHPDGYIFSVSSAVGKEEAESVAEEEEDDGLIVSPSPVKVIELPERRDPWAPAGAFENAEAVPRMPGELDWLSQPLSQRGITWLVNSLTIAAALLLFALVFLSVTRELPKWPVAITGGAALAVVVLYWGFFKLFGGGSPGARLARLAGCDPGGEDEPAARFR